MKRARTEWRRLARLAAKLVRTNPGDPRIDEIFAEMERLDRRGGDYRR